MTEYKPKNHGKKWNALEDKKLLQELNNKLSINEIAQNHNRTRGAIKARIALTVWKMHQNDKSIEEIIEKTKLDRLTIINILDEPTNKKKKPLKNRITTLENEIKEIKKANNYYDIIIRLISYLI